MNKVKVNDFIDVLARCKGFNTEITDIVKEYMQKVISKYEKVFPNGIDASLDNNKSSFLVPDLYISIAGKILLS